MPMHLTLVLPGVLDMADDVAARAPQLGALVGSARMEVARDGLLAAIAAAYGLARQQDWPLAPLRAAAAGLVPGERYWLRAVPITLVAGRDDVRVAGAAAGLDAAHSAALIALLNAHFREDGIEFVAPNPNEWLASIARPPSLATRPLRTVIGRPLRPLLPHGADATRWRRWDHEIQMLLHEHAVNRARENAGLAPVNGVWFDEGGTYPAGPGRPVATWTDDPGVTAAAVWAGAACAPCPSGLGPVIERGEPACIVVLGPTAEVDTIESGFAMPAQAALRRGTIERLTLALDAPGKPAIVAESARRSGWHRLLGRRVAPLASTLAAARALTDA